MKRIIVEHLSKKYQVGSQEEDQGNFRELLFSQITSLWKPTEQKKDFYALDDLSFSIDQGEIFGIIGKNGSGKSTLLKIMSRITAPTSGKITINGRVASLLEVGTGFHGELSGRENIYLSGVILGMKRWEITQRFDEIVVFAGVGNFLSLPVKKYSSGMRLRLAYSIAAHLNPEILLIDEVLAVGDYEFEKKCIDSIDQLGKAGRTIVFVSHNTSVVQKLCSRVLVLKKGKEVFIGDPATAISVHLGTYKAASSEVVWDNGGTVLGSAFLLESVKITDGAGQSKDQFFLDEPVVIELTGTLLDSTKKVMLEFAFYDETRTLLFSTEYFVSQEKGAGLQQRFCCTIPASLFSEGVLKVGIAVFDIEIGKGIVGKSWSDMTLFNELELLSFIMHQRAEKKFSTIQEYLHNKGKINPQLYWTEAVGREK